MFRDGQRAEGVEGEKSRRRVAGCRATIAGTRRTGSCIIGLLPAELEAQAAARSSLCYKQRFDFRVCDALLAPAAQSRSRRWKLTVNQILQSFLHLHLVRNSTRNNSNCSSDQKLAWLSNFRSPPGNLRLHLFNWIYSYLQKFTLSTALWNFNIKGIWNAQAQPHSRISDLGS